MAWGMFGGDDGFAFGLEGIEIEIAIEIERSSSQDRLPTERVSISIPEGRQAPAERTTRQQRRCATEATSMTDDSTPGRLPTGTVTFLFTDIEGSTKLWEKHPEAMRQALRRHHALAAAEIEGCGGLVIKRQGEGDSTFAVFPRAPEAVNAASRLQQALLAEAWTTPEPLRVRMALHTGDAEPQDEDYFGPAVNRCARLRAIAHGGQVLLSTATAELVTDELPAGASLKDMGAHRLRDLQRPEQVFQLLHPDLPEAFPRLRSMDNPEVPHNLPQQLTSFIGREREMAEVKRLLGENRLLTLTGAGGTGKSRLALQAAADLMDEYTDGVWLIELAPLADPALVPQAVASVLGVKEEPGKPLGQTLIEWLKPKQLLLLLDNCEHLLLECARLTESIIQSCPRVRILATSREALAVPGEQSLRVPSLSLPPLVDGGRSGTREVGGIDGSGSQPVRSINYQPPPPMRAPAINQYESVRLFADRARLAQPAFAITERNAPAVAQICNRLDGIPLAIELSAARVKAMSVESIAERLDDRFRLLTGGSRTALPRQQTLRALIDWSYDLLDEQEQTLLRRLSVFAGGWTLEAAEKVCSDPEE
jgi:predicted ATPase/class 3 adenylate cyclase